MNVVKLFPALEPVDPEVAAPAPEPDDPPPAPLRRRALRRTPTPAEVLARAARPRGPGPPALDAAAVIAQALDRPAALDGFWAIWLTHQEVLRHRSLRLSGGNRADAEDALGNAMLRAAQAYVRQPVLNPRAWLLTILHNACMDQHRRYAAQATIDETETETPTPAAEAEWTSAAPSPEEALAQAQMERAWRQAMSTLPGLLNDPLRLHLEGWSDDDIARRLNISRELVRKRRQLAKDRLRALLRL